MTTINERSWAGRHWLLLGMLSIAVIAVIVLLVVYAGGGGGGGGNY